MNTEQSEELFTKADRIKAEMQRAEKWIQNREYRFEQCNRRAKELEADRVRKRKIQIQKEIMRKVQVGVRISRDDLNRRQSEMRQCLSAIRDVVTENQSKLTEIQRDKLFDQC